MLDYPRRQIFAAQFKAGIPYKGIKCPACGTMLIRPEQAGGGDPVPKTCPHCGLALEYYTVEDELGMCRWWNVREELPGKD